MIPDTYVAQLELKFADATPSGAFSGLAAAFGNVDSHGDVIMPGAFAESLAERKSQGRTVPMHLMHRFMGGDGLPVGVWQKVEETSRGLQVEGKISGMDTDGGRRIFALVRDGALGGLSIGFKVRPNGATYGKAAGDPKRTLRALDLREISLVDDPSNPLTRVETKRFDTKAQLEDHLIESGLARGAARKVAAAGWLALSGEPEAPVSDPAAAELLKALDRSTLDLKSLGDLFR